MRKSKAAKRSAIIRYFLSWNGSGTSPIQQSTALGKQLLTKHMGYPNTGALAYGLAGGYGATVGGYSSPEPIVILDDGTQHKLIDFIPKIEAFWQARFPDNKD
jgi:hypothetical protein